MNKACRNYYHDLKLVFPLRGKTRKTLLQDIKLRLLEANRENPDITYNELCAELGSPNEIISDYLFDADTDELIHSLRFSHMLRRAVLCAVIVLVTVSALQWGTLIYLRHRLDYEIPSYEEYISNPEYWEN